MRRIVIALACAIALAELVGPAQAASTSKRDADVERGRYIVKIADCNGCHTPNYPESAGAVPEKDWLTGVPLGFQGPWGTTYAANLRLAVAGMTEAQWMKGARQALKPPMPWFSLRDMTDGDLRAVYRFIKSLGPAGQPAPAYVPPGGKVTTPVLTWPQSPPPSK